MPLSKLVIFCIILVSLASLHDCFLDKVFKDDKPLTNPVTGERTGKPPCKPMSDYFVCTNNPNRIAKTGPDCWRDCIAP
ncbi:unnamed protein product [Arabidopsis arenosa]|uniref:Uncharacterized protein n=1 Tax=Arabidopsis arenosa TaxID=38785 RepID=A0A8S2AL08_ARAAE|nr:unnamed protein product [Arabidopsis arenosa]